MGLCYSERTTFKVEILLPPFPLNLSLCFHFCIHNPFSNIPKPLMSRMWQHLSEWLPCHLDQSQLLNILQNDLRHWFYHVAILLKNTPLFLWVTKYFILTLMACHHLLFPPLPPQPWGLHAFSSLQGSNNHIHWWKHLLLSINSHLYHSFKFISFNYRVKDPIFYQGNIWHQQSRLERFLWEQRAKILSTLWLYMWYKNSLVRPNLTTVARDDTYV